MFDLLILLTAAGYHELLGSEILEINPDILIVNAITLSDLATLSCDMLARSRLISFTSGTIVPGHILRQLGYGAYNFHPGPPHFPGLAPAHFAIYLGAEIFGATAHEMIESVDAGPIVAAEFCLVADGISVAKLEMQAFALLVKIFSRLLPKLVLSPEPLPHLPVTWGNAKSSRRMLSAFCDIPPTIEADELERRLSAFAGNHFGIEPTITLHGHRFRFERPTE